MTGRITAIRVDTELGWIVIQDEETGFEEKRFIWSDLVRDYTATDRLRQSIWLSLLRDALVHSLIVTVNDGEEGNLLTSVDLKRV